MFLLQICNQIGQIDGIWVEKLRTFLLLSPRFKHLAERFKYLNFLVDCSSNGPIKCHIGFFSELHLSHGFENFNKLVTILSSRVEIKPRSPLHIGESFYKIAQNWTQSLGNGPFVEQIRILELEH